MFLIRVIASSLQGARARGQGRRIPRGGNWKLAEARRFSSGGEGGEGWRQLVVGQLLIFARSPPG